MDAEAAVSVGPGRGLEVRQRLGSGSQDLGKADEIDEAVRAQETLACHPEAGPAEFGLHGEHAARRRQHAQRFAQGILDRVGGDLGFALEAGGLGLLVPAPDQGHHLQQQPGRQGQRQRDVQQAAGRQLSRGWASRASVSGVPTSMPPLLETHRSSQTWGISTRVAKP